MGNEGYLLYDEYGNLVTIVDVQEPESDDPQQVYIVQNDTPLSVVLADRPFLTTEFSDYSVIEGFWLLLVILIFVGACAKILRMCFRWLQ